MTEPDNEVSYYREARYRSVLCYEVYDNENMALLSLGLCSCSYHRMMNSGAANGSCKAIKFGSWGWGVRKWRMVHSRFAFVSLPICAFIVPFSTLVMHGEE